MKSDVSELGVLRARVRALERAVHLMAGHGKQGPIDGDTFYLNGDKYVIEAVKPVAGRFILTAKPIDKENQDEV